ncbi:MAG: formylglycine-generating enzyme family protein [Pirellulaceae bacterium]
MSKLLPLASLSVVLAVGVMLVGCSNQEPAVGPDTGQEADEAKRRQRETAKALGQREEITNSIGMTLKLIPAGEFLMGSPEDEDDRSSPEGPQTRVRLTPGRELDVDVDWTDEGPQHRVRITQPFYLAETEVTQGQWEAVMESQPWSDLRFAEEGTDYAANYISWKDAVAFCERLSEEEGRTYRLPTEAEWEYACRAGTSTAYCFGDDPSELDEYAWFHDNANDAGEEYAHEVAQKGANGFGLYDMHGNVWEWCADRYGSDYYGDSPTEDPSGPTSGSARVCRGGSWNSLARRCRSANRYSVSPGYHYNYLGFRVALVAAE